MQFVDELILSDEAKLNPTIETNPRIAIPAEADIVLFSKNARKSNNIFNNLKTASMSITYQVPTQLIFLKYVHGMTRSASFNLHT